MKQGLFSALGVGLKLFIAGTWVLATQNASAGQAGVKVLNVKVGDGLKVPTLVIFPEAPQVEALPVLIMDHGFLLNQQFYQDILGRIAIEGFVVVAPQNYAPGGLPFGKPTTDVEAKTTVAAVTWFQSHLADMIGKSVDFSKMGLINHSRGGKVAWTILRDHLLDVKAIAAIDPVDGTADGSSRVTGGAAQIKVPALIIGTGLGAQGGQPCAPAAVNYNQFWMTVSQSPSWLFVAKDYGHMDFLDENNSCGFICSFCAKTAKSQTKVDLRGWIGMTVANFMRGILYNDKVALDQVEDNASSITLSKAKK